MRTNNKQEVSASTQRRMTVVYLLTILLGLACLVKILYLIHKLFLIKYIQGEHPAARPRRDLR